jgi:mono/diheme cytochrome c family protein
MRLTNPNKRFGWVFRSQSGVFGAGMIGMGLFLVMVAGLLLVNPARANVEADQPEVIQPAAPALQGDLAAQGQQIFNDNCAACHTIGGGKLIGPDLKDITKSRDPQWIKSFISDPAKMIASDAAAKQLAQEYSITMPTLGLSDDKIDAVLAYLTNPAAAPAAPAAAAGTGNAAIGQKLFTGEQPMANGGAACFSCHTVGGTGALGGGNLGPDLTHVIQRLGEPGVSAALKTIVFPTMQGPFLNKPLTPAEQADLVAFLKQADQMQPPQPAFAPGSFTINALVVFAIGLSGVLLLFGLLWFFWSRLNRYRTTRLPVRKL